MYVHLSFVRPMYVQNPSRHSYPISKMSSPSSRFFPLFPSSSLHSLSPGTSLTSTSIYTPSSSSQNENKEIPVTPITLYKSESLSEYGKVMTVNEEYIAYPIRNGLVRIIHQASVHRTLGRELTGYTVTDLAWQGPYLIAAGKARHDDNLQVENGKMIVWKMNHTEEGVLHEVVYENEVVCDRLVCHPTKGHRFVSMHGVMVTVLQMVHSGAWNLERLELHEHDEQVVDIAWSPTGQHVVTVTSSEVAVFGMDTGKMTSSTEGLDFCSVVYLNSNRMLVGQESNTVLNLYTADVTLVQTVRIPEGKYTIAIDRSGAYIVIANTQVAKLMVIHFDEASGRMNNLREFDVSHPILSMTVFTKSFLDPREELELELFCIQTQAIQQYHIATSRCYVPGTGAEVATAPTLNKMLSNEQVVAGPLEGKKENGDLSPFPILTSMDTAGPDDVISLANDMPTDQGSLTHSSECTPTVDPRPVLFTMPASRGSSNAAARQERGFDTVEIAKMEELFTSVFRSEMKSTLLPAISRIVTNTSEQHVLNPLQSHLETIVPTLATNVSRSMSSLFTGPVFTRQLSECLTTSSSNMAIGLEKPMRAAFSSAFQEHIIPSFQGATQKMVKQINSSLANSLSKNNTPLTSENAVLTKKIDDLTHQMSTLVETVGTLTEMIASLQSTVRTQIRRESAASIEGLPVVIDVKAELMKMVSDGHFAAAFEKALSAESVDLVFFLCQNTSSKTILNGDENYLPPLLVLCLVQQLGSTLVKETAMKLEWIRDALLVLNADDTTVTDMVQNVLQDLQRNLKSVNPENRDSSYFIVQHILKSLQS